jgi:cell division protein FtsA
MDIVVGLDLGTSKTACAIGGWEGGQFRILGLGTAPSDGVRAGVIVNLRAAMGGVQKAVQEAARGQYTVKNLIVGLAGGTVEGLNSRGVVAVSAQTEIGRHDVERVIDAAKAVVIPTDREIMHVLPQEFIVDSARRIKDPLGMQGIRLEAEVHIVTSTQAVKRNLVSGLATAGLTVDEVVLDTLATARAVVHSEEKDVGVLVVDIGAGTTDVALYFDGAPRFSKVYPLGADRVTKDIAQVLQIPDDEAERLKRQAGHAWVPGLTEDDEVIVREVGSRPAFTLSRSQLAQIIQARAQELLELVVKDVQKTGYLEQLGAGVVLTGGGAHLDGITELAGQVFGKPARMGLPVTPGVTEAWQRPEYAAAVGLVLWGRDQMPEPASSPSARAETRRPESEFRAPRSVPTREKTKTAAPGEGLWSRVWDFIKKNFI